jgi:hypothetical protein
MTNGLRPAGAALTEVCALGVFMFSLTSIPFLCYRRILWLVPIASNVHPISMLAGKRRERIRGGWGRKPGFTLESLPGKNVSYCAANLAAKFPEQGGFSLFHPARPWVI